MRDIAINGSSTSPRAASIAWMVYLGLQLSALSIICVIPMLIDGGSITQFAWFSDNSPHEGIRVELLGYNEID